MPRFSSCGTGNAGGYGCLGITWGAVVIEPLECSRSRHCDALRQCDRYALARCKHVDVDAVAIVQQQSTDRDVVGAGMEDFKRVAVAGGPDQAVRGVTSGSWQPGGSMEQLDARARRKLQQILAVRMRGLGRNIPQIEREQRLLV